jgi:dATP pyrophosphohydrolase
VTPQQAPAARYKQPISVLVVVHTVALEVLLLERADYPDHWQSVTGSQEPGETLEQTAVRELGEETGLAAGEYGGVVDWHLHNDFEIFRQWRNRFAPGTTHNREHAFGLTVPRRVPVRLAPREHRAFVWLPWRQAAAKCFSWTNRAAIELLPQRMKGNDA